MENKSLSVAFVCALGAFIGGLIALELPHGLWWIGALLGGVVAYVAVDFAHFRAGIARAWRETVAWRPYRLYWRAFFAQWVGNVVVWSYITIGVLALIMTPDLTQGQPILNELPVWLYGSMFLLVAMMSLYVATLETIQNDSISNEKYGDYLQKKADRGLFIAIRFNPISVWVFGPYYTLKGMKWVLINSPRFVVQGWHYASMVFPVVKEFVYEVFVLVHSERRTICFVDATLGSAVGYFCGNAIIGALAGALFGVVNYEIVSVRWLKITPR